MAKDKMNRVDDVMNYNESVNLSYNIPKINVTRNDTDWLISEINKTKTFKVDSYNGISPDVIIPSTYKNNPIVSVEKNAFNNNNYVLTVSIPEGIEKVGEGAFTSCLNLNNVTFPNTVTDIGSKVFNNCNRLERVEIGEGVTTIKSCSFYNCKNLKEVILPSTIEIIEDSTFYGFSNLENVRFNNGIDYKTLKNVSDNKFIESARKYRCNNFKY